MKEKRYLKFINEDMRFLTVDNLFFKIKFIKEEYSKLDNDHKEIYKLYLFFQICNLPDSDTFPAKTVIWDYISCNGIVSIDDVFKIYDKIKNNRKKYEIYYARENNLFNI